MYKIRAFVFDSALVTAMLTGKETIVFNEQDGNKKEFSSLSLLKIMFIFALIGPPFGVITYSEYVCFMLMAPSAHPRQR